MGRRDNANIFSRTFSSVSTTNLQSLPAPDIIGDEKQEVIWNNYLSDSLKHPDYFGVHKLFTVKDLFEARVHLGHKEGTLHEHMVPYFFGTRLGHLVFDLDQTAEHLRKALNFAAHIAFRNGIILFINRQREVKNRYYFLKHRETSFHTFLLSINNLLIFQMSTYVEKTALECGEYSHCRLWRDNTFTDSPAVYKTVTRLPDLVIFINTLSNIFEQHPAVRSSAKLLIPTIGIVDSNCNPTLITYPVPGNDDTPCAVKLYCNLFKKAILAGKEKRKILEEEIANKS